MSISLVFSATLYTLSVRELDRGFHRQDGFIDRFPNEASLLPPSFQRQFAESREVATQEAKARLLANLFVATLAIFVLAGGLSYALARRSLEPIEQSHRALEQFTADASHELRTPIAAMKSEIEVALLQPKLSTKEVKQLLASNLEEIDSLTLLTANLLSLARLEESSLHIKSQAIKPVLEASVKKVRPMARKSDIKIELTADRTLKGVFDSVALTEVLVILLDNAIKYGAAGSLVRVFSAAHKESISISVENSGPGIDANDLPYVFDRFYQSDRSRAKQHNAGHGLGLSIAKQLVDRQSGSISIASQPDKTTVVTIRLPGA